MRLETQERQPAGTPSGGQFAAGSTGEPTGVSLNQEPAQAQHAWQTRRAAQEAALPTDLGEASLWDAQVAQALVPTVDTARVGGGYRGASDEDHLDKCRHAEGQVAWPDPTGGEFDALADRCSRALAADGPREIFDEKDTDERAATVYRGFLSHLDDTERDEAFAAMDELGAGPPLVFDSAVGQATNRDDVDRYYQACADAVRPWVVKDAQTAHALQEQGHAHP